MVETQQGLNLVAEDLGGLLAAQEELRLEDLDCNGFSGVLVLQGKIHLGGGALTQLHDHLIVLVLASKQRDLLLLVRRILRGMMRGLGQGYRWLAHGAVTGITLLRLREIVMLHVVRVV